MRSPLLTSFHDIRGKGVPLIRGSNGRVTLQLVRPAKSGVPRSNIQTVSVSSGGAVKRYRPLQFR